MSKAAHIGLTIALNGLVPWGLYVWLSDYMSSFAALSMATLVPLIENVFYLLKHKKVDAFGSLMLFTFVLSLALVLMGGDEKLLLVRESFITASVGLIFLGSLLFPRPLLFYLALRFTVAKEGDSRNAFLNNWNIGYFRSVIRTMTAVWGLVFVAEAAVRTVLVYRMPVADFLLVSNFVLYGFLGAVILWTIVYRKRARRRLNELKPDPAPQIKGV